MSWKLKSVVIFLRIISNFILYLYIYIYIYIYIYVCMYTYISLYLHVYLCLFCVEIFTELCNSMYV